MTGWKSRLYTPLNPARGRLPDFTKNLATRHVRANGPEGPPPPSRWHPGSVAGRPFHRLIGQNPVKGSWMRKIFPRTNRPEAGKAFVNELVHQSALDRFGKNAPVQEGKDQREETYQPDNLAAARGKLAVVGDDGEVIEAPA